MTRAEYIRLLSGVVRAAGDAVHQEGEMIAISTAGEEVSSRDVLRFTTNMRERLLYIERRAYAATELKEGKE